MHYFDYWFQNVVSTAGMISSPDALTKAWIQKERDITSAYDIRELIEQLLGDLHLHENLGEFKDKLRHIGALEVVGGFTEALLDLENKLRTDANLQNPETLLATPEWQELSKLAKRITQLPAAGSVLMS